MGSNKHKRQWKQKRKEFRKDILELCKNNPALCMAIINQYTSWKHHKHIMRIWDLLGFNHKAAYKDYCDKLMGQTLSGDFGFNKTLYFISPELYKKWYMGLPEKLKMSEAYGSAMSEMKSMQAAGKFKA